VSTTYAEFLQRKSQIGGMDGFAPLALCEKFKPFQAFLTEWAIRKGRAGLFEAVGLGKTVKDQARDSARRHPRTRLRQVLRKYGMTLEDYDRMVAEQDGKCAICGREGGADNTKKRLAVDHCHETNLVRGLLCTNCNQGIGNFKDDSEVIKMAVAYLRLFQEEASQQAG